jgi:predicted transcriptional regulator
MPNIEIEDDVLEMLKELAEPFVDTPSSVIRRALEAGGSANGRAGQAAAAAAVSHGRRKRGRRAPKRTAPRAQPGTILADNAYELPLLAVLDEHGGRVPTSEALEALGERLRDKLMPADFEELSTGDVRWRNRAQFVRLHLIKSGDMKPDSPRGMWEITDQGRDRLVSQ